MLRKCGKMAQLVHNIFLGSYLYIQILVQKNVLQLEVSMHNPVLQDRRNTLEVLLLESLKEDHQTV